MKNAADIIRKAGVVTTAIRENYFKGQGFAYIRDFLEKNGLDRHMAIELQSTEIAIVTPEGVIMQIRPADNNKLGLWGGALEMGETPLECALRELREETGLEVHEDSLKFIEENLHTHQYANGDKALFQIHRFQVRFDFVPEICIDAESKGWTTLKNVVPDILAHQQEFVSRILAEK